MNDTTKPAELPGLSYEQIEALITENYGENVVGRDLIHRVVSAALAASAAKAVPAEPTREMLEAARDWSVKKYGQGIGNDAATGCWAAMLAAAPTPAAQAPDIVERLKEAHDASLDDDHRACRAILLECIRLLSPQPTKEQGDGAAKLTAQGGKP